MIELMHSKVCRTCKNLLTIDFFNKKKLGKYGVDTECKVCRNARYRLSYSNESRAKRREQYQERIDIRQQQSRNQYAKRLEYNRKYYSDNRLKNKQLIVDMLGGKCSRCGLVPSEIFPISCFQFHHKDGDKNFNIANRLGKPNISELVKSEINKCVLLCANCHFATHWYENKGEN